MKKIIKPAEREEAVHYSDFSGKCFGDFTPPVVLKMEFNYGSKFDGFDLRLDLCDDDILPFLDIIEKNASEEFKAHMEKKLIATKNEYESAIDSRDWIGCDHLGNTLHFLKRFCEKDPSGK